MITDSVLNFRVSVSSSENNTKLHLIGLCFSNFLKHNIIKINYCQDLRHMASMHMHTHTNTHLISTHIHLKQRLLSVIYSDTI